MGERVAGLEERRKKGGWAEEVNSKIFCLKVAVFSPLLSMSIKMERGLVQLPSRTFRTGTKEAAPELNILDCSFFFHSRRAAFVCFIQFVGVCRGRAEPDKGSRAGSSWRARLDAVGGDDDKTGKWQNIISWLVLSLTGVSPAISFWEPDNSFAVRRPTGHNNNSNNRNDKMVKCM